MSTQDSRVGDSPLRVLGIDPGSKATGFGVVERRGAKSVHVAHGTIRVPTSASDLAGRLAYVFEEVAGVVERYAPDVASVEQVFVSASPRSALVLGQARGAALVALARAGVAVAEYSPAEIKQSVAGNGRAAKDQVQRLVKRLLALDRVPAQDAADALAAALCHAQAGPLAGLSRVPSRRRSRARGSSLRVRRAP
jgi:crossover junction endodeoxyribonuclease RuvC